jgi:hypothetical protein
MDLIEKQSRLREVYKYLRKAGLIHTQNEFSALIGASYCNISRAMNGDKRYLTDKLLDRVAYSLQNYINRDWLIMGVGEMLVSEVSEQIPPKCERPVIARLESVSDVDMKLFEIIEHQQEVLKEFALELKEINMQLKRIMDKLSPQSANENETI